jgi:hypothetical protein
MRFALLLAGFTLLAVSLSTPAQTPAERQRLYQIFQKKGIPIDAAGLAKVEMELKMKGITLDQFEAFMLKGILPGQSLKAPLTAPLVEPAVLTKLNLSLQQRGTFTKLNKEFEAKNKVLIAKLPDPTLGDDIRSQIEGKIREALGQGVMAPPPEFQQSLDLRKEYEDKFEAMLTPSQKKIVEAARVKAAEGLLTGGSK